MGLPLVLVFLDVEWWCQASVNEDEGDEVWTYISLTREAILCVLDVDQEGTGVL